MISHNYKSREEQKSQQGHTHERHVRNLCTQETRHVIQQFERHHINNNIINNIEYRLATNTKLKFLFGDPRITYSLTDIPFS